MGILEVWLGTAGTGKSARIADDVARAIASDPFGPPLYWVVPAEATYAIERLLVQRITSAVRAEVLTMPRLAERVCADLGCAPQPRAGAAGKRLVLAQVFHQLRDQLHVLRRPDPSVRFLDAVLAVFRVFAEAELHADFAGRPEAPSGFAGGPLPGKVRDLLRLYEGYRNELQARGWMDPDELLTAVRPHLPAWPKLRGATVYFDGFADLSPAGIAFLLEAAAAADRAVVTLSVDPAWLRLEHASEEAPRWVYAPQTVALLLSLEQAAAARGLWVSRVSLEGAPVRFRTPDLRRLHRLWTPDPEGPADTAAEQPADASAEPLADASAAEPAEQPAPCSGARASGQAGSGEWPSLSAREAGCGSVCLAGAPNVRAEADGVAREILRLVTEDGLSWGDVAVVAPRLEWYAPHLRDSFDKYGVPYNLDLPLRLSVHPLGRLLLAALDVCETGWSFESALRWLKCELAGLRPADADWLEQYLRR
ncbi:MAG: hypothetical protein K6T30_06550, partial [Alicyclobacillus sp.]|nr:hypothetical protein [Alicyclobacillus sp.]